MTQLQASLPSTSSASPAEISREIKSLIKELPEIRADAARLDELRRLFTRLEAEGELSFGTATTTQQSLPNRSGSAVAAKWHAFLHKSHKTMVSQLCERVQLGRHSASMRCLWGVIAGSPFTRHHSKSDASTSSCYKQVNTALLQQWLDAMTKQEHFPMNKGTKQMVEGEFFGPYRDVQYYSLGCISALATAAAVHTSSQESGSDTDDGNNNNNNDDGHINAGEKEKLAQRLLELLMMIPVPSSEEELEGNSQYLFPPPTDFVPDDEQEEKHSDSDESDEESDDDDGDDSDDSSDEESGDNNDARPSKRQKVDQQHKFPFQRMRTFRREYQKAWLSVLRLPLPMSSLKQALHYIPENVLNYISQPLRFADFFMQAYSDHENSGVIGILALDGLFLLITEYGLEYPNFYKQLYKLVSAKALYGKHRTRFFSLLTKCLVRNEMLPAHLVAAYVKRSCRCALSGPPSGALFVLALVSNLLRKHPECSCLIQRKEGSEIEDSFLPDEDDPVECRALHSSLWELAVFEKHYYPAVATLAKSIGRQEEDKTPMHHMEDFSGHTYTSLFAQEKKKKKKTALTFKKPDSLFTDDDVFAGCLEMGSR
ncbi:MAG: hypothetical protein SGILL_001927 [Bacillariaceae sp.]